MTQDNILSDYKFQSSYSKYQEKLGRKETWDEAVKRIMMMHYDKLQRDVKDYNMELEELLDYAWSAYNEKLILGSNRSLQFGGEPILKHEAKMYNCLVSYCDRPTFFQETMYWLLCGCGVGFSVQNEHINKLTNLNKREKGVKTFTIPDSIEGWSDAVGILVSSYLEGTDFPNYEGYRIDFDFNEIRPKGAMISGGFKAPGPEGLRNSLIKIQKLLDSEVNKEFFNGTFRSIVAYDIIMHISNAVLSGGVRRSATICLFSPDDEDMMTAKTGDWFITNPQRARSNNSVLLIRDKTSKEFFNSIIESTKQWGEPGFVWSSDVDNIFNPLNVAA